MKRMQLGDQPHLDGECGKLPMHGSVGRLCNRFPRFSMEHALCPRLADGDANWPKWEDNWPKKSHVIFNPMESDDYHETAWILFEI